MRIKKSVLLDRIFDICNLNSNDDDIIIKTMYQYKTIINESKDVQYAIYNYLSHRMGYLENIEDQVIDLIKKSGY